MRDNLNPSLAVRSWILFGLSIVLWIGLTLFESALLGMPPMLERLVTMLGLVLPAGIGAVSGAMSLIRQERPAWLGFLSMLLNILFALFHLMIILFAG